jgi:hypothetical protein
MRGDPCIKLSEHDGEDEEGSELWFYDLLFKGSNNIQ